MKIRYIGPYAGFAPLLSRNVKPGDEMEVSEKDGKKALTSGQFEEVKEKKPSKKPVE